jgi:hypothetical protein
MSDQLWACVSSDGELSGAEMLKELQEHNIAPFMTVQTDGKVVVPLFVNQRVAEKFTKRNTHKDWATGTFPISKKELAQFEERGWETEIWDYPKKRPITIEVVELNREIETRNKGYKRHIK